jgi:hypothetical protein
MAVPWPSPFAATIRVIFVAGVPPLLMPQELLIIVGQRYRQIMQPTKKWDN